MPALRVVTGSYEHNLLCVALTFGNKGEVFTPIFHFTPHIQSIRCLAWTKKVLISGSNDEIIRLYDLQHRTELGSLMHHSGAILCLEVYKNKWLFSGSGDGKICLWRTKDWELLAELKGHKAPVVDMSVHSSGKIMLSVSEDHKLILWNLMTARKASVRKLRESPRQVSFAPNTQSQYVIAYPKSVVYYASNGQALRKWEMSSPIHRTGWYKDQLIVSTDDGKLTFYNLEKDEPEFSLQGHASRVKDFAVLDTYMASVSSDGNIVVWDLEKRDQIAVYNSGDRLNCVALIPDEIEKSVKRRVEPEVEDDGNASDFSEVDEPKAVLPPKKKKKSRVVVTKD